MKDHACDKSFWINFCYTSRKAFTYIAQILHSEAKGFNDYIIKQYSQIGLIPVDDCVL